MKLHSHIKNTIRIVSTEDGDHVQVIINDELVGTYYKYESNADDVLQDLLSKLGCPHEIFYE